MGVAHDQDSDGGPAAYVDQEPVTPADSEDGYPLEYIYWIHELAEIEAQEEELQKRRECRTKRKQEELQKRI